MNIRRLFSSAVLTLILSFSAIAGDTWIPGLNDPPLADCGKVTSSASQSDISAFDTLTESAALLCQSLLVLL